MASDGTKVRKSYELDKDLDTWYKTNYPAVSIWWFINALLRSFMDLHEVEKPRNKLLDHIDEAARKVEEPT
jgi:hypothetical protein